ncbi:hypothetical protein BH11ACT8_BH11ACT8_01830 [soil metagenome]
MSTRRSAITALVADALPGYADPQALPHDLNAVAKALGVADIRYVAREVHGFTDWSSDKPTVFLSISRSDGRRRFTLAHECGHLMLGDEGQRAQHNPLITPRILEDIELTCDAIAAEILIPFTWLDLFGKQITCLRQADHAARHLRVSLSTLVVRMGHWQTGPLMIQLQRAPDGEWMPVHRVGAPKPWRGPLTLAPHLMAALEAAESGESIVDFDAINTGGARLTGAADLRKRRSDQATLFLSSPHFDSAES